MNRSKLTGWKDVFSFTLQQTTKGKAFKTTTICLALILFIAVCTVNVVTAANDNKKKGKESPIQIVQVLDESGLATTDFSMLSTMNESFSQVDFIAAEAGRSTDEILKDMQNTSDAAVLLHITRDNEGYGMRIGIPANSSISESDAEDLLSQAVTYFELIKLTQIGLTDVQLASINIPVTTSFTEAGEKEESVGEMLIKMFAPMLFSFVLYIMLLLYGQSICKTLVTEKTSKLMEVLLTSATPYAIITGKILAMTVLAIFQFILWLSCALAGFFMGDYIAQSMYPEYQNEIISVLELVKENTNVSAFSIPSILLAIVALCIGFLFYSILAGMVGSILNKAEDLSSGMSIFQIPVVISFFAAYFIAFQGGSTATAFVRYFPFTSPFSVPADLVIGNMGFVEGIISLVILLLTTYLFIVLTGKLYKGLVLYNGDKLSAKNIYQLLKTKF